MSVTVYIHIELDGFPEKKSKIKVPKSWINKTVKDVLGLFTKSYNEKNPDTQIDIENVHIESEEKKKLYSDEVVSAVLEDYGDYYIKKGQNIKPVAVIETIDKDLLRCRNYGCNKNYKEEENSDDACAYHTGPPIFHDTMKCWSCCRDRKSYDFESFQKITGCAIGRHSNQVQAIAIAASPNAPTESSGAATDSVFTAPLKSISSYNQENPDGPTAAASAAKTMVRKSSRNADGVTAKCQRKGCQKTFTLAENNPTACKYHKGQPIFHDAIKFWGCCPERKCFDFDEFLAVPGCAVGCHDDGVIEL